MWLLSFITGTLGRWLIMGGLGIGIVAGAYVKGRMDCTSAYQVAQLQETVRYLNAEIARREAKTAADNAARERDRAERDRLDALNKELLDELEDPDRVCLDAGDTDRLRRVWPKP